MELHLGASVQACLFSVGKDAHVESKRVSEWKQKPQRNIFINTAGPSPAGLASVPMAVVCLDSDLHCGPFSHKCSLDSIRKDLRARDWTFWHRYSLLTSLAVTDPANCLLSPIYTFNAIFSPTPGFLDMMVPLALTQLYGHTVVWSVSPPDSLDSVPLALLPQGPPTLPCP